ncbi:DUF1351 domain-containing protein [Lactobacillus intestinalis]|uniref:DUF1351 domain-containing protein n=1 Tax=Lactobacillus intestinalis TaxID=151781 RepID=UPI001F5AE1E6|nr:DUF1351 domain-containing protein [Lactobacillus intestinalis]
MLTKELRTIDIDELPVSYKPAEIEFKGYDDMKAQIDELTQSLKSYEVTPQNLKQAKYTRAKLNAFRKAINDRKLEITRQAERPIKDFKNKVKTLTAEIDKSSTKIGDEIKVYEEKAKKERHQKNLEHINAMCELAEVDAKQIDYDSRWDNKTFSKNAFENAVDRQIAVLVQQKETYAQNVKVVSQEAEELALPVEHWLEELKIKPLADVLQAMYNYKADLNKIAETQHETKIKEQSELVKQGNKLIDPTTGEVKEKLVAIRLEVEGTNWQMEQLQSFLKDNGITYRGI